MYSQHKAAACAAWRAELAELKTAWDCGRVVTRRRRLHAALERVETGIAGWRKAASVTAENRATVARWRASGCPIQRAQADRLEALLDAVASMGSGRD